MRFGIICAMPEEIKELTAKLSDKQEKKIGGKSYLFGKINNQDVVLVESGIGKVEAGITTEHLITVMANSQEKNHALRLLTNGDKL